ncbi:flagellar basal body protein [Rhizobium sp. RU36D]|uniref:flagellar basal body protein n=1 Tax=Rhizobium sp. RU36D TaxID=1907415 RepID=UPI0009D8FA12|nr:flagellar basal body protein [Rhizobium sp. RU36D]SMC81823.1 flagellar basal-body rod protein FlgC [Rhizobium sp. RU36D]
MSLSIAMTNAVSGMQAGATRSAATANNVANALTPGYARQQVNLSTAPGGGVSASVSQDQGAPVDLGQEMFDLLETSTTFKANAAVFETGADMWDVLMTMVRD